MDPQPAPGWQTTTWLNTPEPLTLEQLRGRVVLLHAFQMLCPGCVARGIPQAQRVATAFADAPLTVVGLHTVFEHHEAMQLPSLRAFLYEYRVTFPVGIDAPGLNGSPHPRTMSAYQMRGTPTTVLIDARGDCVARCSECTTTWCLGPNCGVDPGSDAERGGNAGFRHRGARGRLRRAL